MTASRLENSYLGLFWMPENGEKHAVPGILDLDRSGGVARLQSVLCDDQDLADAVIFARLQGFQDKASLYNCFGSSSRNATGAALSSRVSTTLVAIGAWQRTLAGFAIEFRLPGSEMWLDDPCFEMDLQTDTAVSVHFKAWETSSIPLPGGFSLERVYRATIPGDRRGVERYEILRPMSHRIISPSRLPFEDLWDHMRHIKRFFEFMTQSHLPIESICLYDKADTDSHLPDIQLHVAEPGHLIAGKPNRHGFLVQPHKLRESVPDLVHNWIKMLSGHPEPFSHYFKAFDRNREDPVLHFTQNIAAFEELHKLRHGRKRIDLADRLSEQIRTWSTALSNPPTTQVVNQIKDSRHYYTHAAGDLRDKAAKDWVLLRYGDFLAAMNNLEILRLLGLEVEEVVSMAKSLDMQESLNLTRYPGID